MLSLLRPALVLTLLFTGLTGLAYPLAITVLAQGLLPRQSNGELIVRGNRVIERPSETTSREKRTF